MAEEHIPGFEFEEGLYSPPIDVRRLAAAYPVTIGRRSGNDLVLHHDSVSGLHAQLEVDESDGRRAWYIRDIGSTNGTRVEGERVYGRKQLTNGDLVRLGDVGLRFGLLPYAWWEDSRRNYLSTALPWSLAVPFFHSQVAPDAGHRVRQLYTLCEEMTRLVTAAGSAVAAAIGGADAALRWALNRLRNPKPMDWEGAVRAVVRAGSDRGWLQHLPGLIGSAAGQVPGTEGAWEALTQWVRTTHQDDADADPNTMEAVQQVLRPAVNELLLAWTFLHEGRLIWVERAEDWSFTVHVAHGINEAVALEGIRFHGQIPAERTPYWILSAAGGAACLSPWYRVGPSPDVPVVGWSGCPVDLTPGYRAVNTDETFMVQGDDAAIPLGSEGTLPWTGFRDFLAADRSLGAVVDLQMSPDDWARILGVSGDAPPGL